jgi:NAD(P)-dependent dehydrogenase (short-subunit alcohol dehydrogenase family)
MKLPFQIDLKDKVAVVTGGGGVLCSAFAKALAACGAKVAVLDLRKAQADLVAEQIRQEGGTAIGVEANVLDKESLEKAHKVVCGTFGSCDILLNGAGGNHPKGTTTKEYLFPEDLSEGKNDIVTFFDLDPKGVEFVFNLNFIGTLLPTQVFSKDMVGKEGTVIINISSMNAFTPLTKIPAYSGAKAAVSNFTQWLAVHMAKVGIRVNAIAPGFFLTEQNRSLLLNEDGSYTERSRKILSQTPMGRFGEKEELIGTLLYLVDSKASGFVNGVVIPVDGGFSAYSGV